jgi:hypothetical protein
MARGITLAAARFVLWPSRLRVVGNERGSMPVGRPRPPARFRLVNHLEIATDDAHVNPPRADAADDTVLRETLATVKTDPRHIFDRRVLSVIYMFRIAPPDAREIGRALIGQDAIGIATVATDRFATIAHEIGHLMLRTDSHSTDFTKVMNNPGPGTDLTDGQITAARAWAAGFAGFWRH